jgi:hypothetical protein
MTVVHYEQPAPLPASRPGDELELGPTGWVAKLRAAAEFANYIGDTEFVPQALRGNRPAIAAAILYGDELGLTPLQALRSIVVIKGTPSLTAEAHRARVLAEGHELWFEESTTTRAIAAGRRRGEERIGRITWTIDDAKRAGIAGGNAWRTYPAEMLRARASAALARTMFPDVVGGLVTAEELEDGTDNNGPTIPPPTPPPPPPADVQVEEKPKATRTRKRAPAREPVAPTPPADEQPEPELPATEPLATDAYRRKIFALMRNTGLEGREERLDYTSAIIGREIQSSNELTIGEASKLIEALEALAERKAAQSNEQQVVETLETELDAKPVDEPVPYNEFPPGY